ncbi:MAG TPA: hypothetical protein VF316_06305 [Polyangiaceae bacterium]
MNRSTCVRGGLFFALLFTAACSGSSGPDGWGDAASADDGSTDDGGSTSDDSAVANDSGTKPDSSTISDSGVADTGIVANSGDGFGAARTACVNEINKLRATQGHAAYQLWETSAIDTCVDQQATYDETANSAHDAWINKKYPTCNGNAQDECLGYGTTPSAVVACLDSMWAEKNQPNCANCAACNGTTLNQNIMNCLSTPTCDFYGNYGSECGHYVNMSADYFTQVACGFSTLPKGSWATQNFK